MWIRIQAKDTQAHPPLAAKLNATHAGILNAIRLCILATYADEG